MVVTETSPSDSRRGGQRNKGKEELARGKTVKGKRHRSLHSPKPSACSFCSLQYVRTLRFHVRLLHYSLLKQKIQKKALNFTPLNMFDSMSPPPTTFLFLLNVRPHCLLCALTVNCYDWKSLNMVLPNYRITRQMDCFAGTVSLKQVWTR